MVKKTSISPSVRHNIMNTGMVFLYCDYAGFASQNNYGVACSIVYNRTIHVTAKKLIIEHDEGSNYGELLAIVYSLEQLTTVLKIYQAKAAIIYTDCSSISRILSEHYVRHPYYENARDKVIASLNHLNNMFPNVKININYIRKHKNNNPLHRMAHNAARKAAHN
nr:RNase H family protein [Paenibacillus castaneae]